MIKKILAAIALGILPAATAFAQIVPAPTGSPDGNSFNGPMINLPLGLAYSNTFAIDLAKYDASKVSAQVLLSTLTFTTPTVSDGSQSTGSFKVLTYTALSSASATNTFTVVNNTFTTLPTLTIGNNVLTMGQQFQNGSSAHATAANIAAAISLLPNLAASVGGGTSGIVYTTATAGSYANSWAFVSNNSSVTAGAALMSGGQDNAVVTINGVALTQGLGTGQWRAVTSNAVTATNLAAAINTAFTGVLTSSNGAVATASVYSTSTFNGAAYNFSMVSSTPTALLASQAVMTNGANPGFLLNGKTFTAGAATGFPLALPVIYPVGSTPAIGGLTTGTTYYAVPLSATQFQLAKYSTSAVAGAPLSDFVTVTSTNSGITAHSYSFPASIWTGSATFIWQASNDNSNWATAPSTGTVTVTNVSANLNSLLDFGVYNYRYLRFNYTAPTQGAASVVVPVNIKQDGIGRF